MRTCLVFISLCFVTFVTHAQGCDDPSAYAFLDVANVRTPVFNNGGLQRSGRLPENGPSYEIPKGSGFTASFSASLLVGGMVDRDLRVSGANYGNFEFWPGPGRLLPDGDTPCASFDRTHSVYYEDLIADPIPENVREWPWELGAPIVDGDGNPDNYDPDAGDRPEILGDQSIWWLMNDMAGVHEQFETEPLGLEIRGTAFAGDYAEPIRNTTFYRYRIRNVSDNLILDAFLGFFIDVDLGDFHDDYLGSDSTLGLAYYYTADSTDGVYGEPPPAFGYTFITGPRRQHNESHDACILDAGERLSMTSHQWVLDSSSPPRGVPREAFQAYSLLQGLNQDGTSRRIGGFWWTDNDDQPFTKWVMAGDPLTKSFPSEYNFDGMGTAMNNYDRKSYIGMGPFCLSPGEEEEFTLAIVWSQGADHLDSVRQLKEDVALIRASPDAWLTPRKIEKPVENDPPKPTFPLSLTGVYPNPAHGLVQMDYAVPQTVDVSIEVFDMIGRRIVDAFKGIRDAGKYTEQFDVSDWAPGVYVARVRVNHVVATRRFVVVKPGYVETEGDL